jgi:hypothetical protein
MFSSGKSMYEDKDKEKEKERLLNSVLFILLFSSSLLDGDIFLSLYERNVAKAMLLKWKICLFS